ncbi:MAG: hypothetical protein Q8936_09020 [Bacillota bacterium]|nr:hypothetical protein [Bacillota bacterium]
MRYIGPFLRSNTLDADNIKNQLFHLAKESLKDLVLKSKCGIPIKFSELKTKNIPNNDISIFKAFSPLLCLYKKGDNKFELIDGELIWNEKKFKKTIVISGNAFMTLSILELADYYKKFKNIHPNKYYLSSIYTAAAKKQLEFYAANLRNFEGVFVDKKDISDSVTQEIKLEEKNNKFKFSDQALLMAAYYKYANNNEDKENESYKMFALDIFNMFLQFRDEIYALPMSDLLTLCLALNIFYEYSGTIEAKALLLDIFEFTIDKYFLNQVTCRDDLFTQCMLCLNSIMLYKSTNLSKFKDYLSSHIEKLIELYDHNYGIFSKNPTEKLEEFSCEEIMLYVINLLMYYELESSTNDIGSILADVFKHQVINSGIIGSWPDPPNLDDPERYNNCSFKSEDLIGDQHFKLSTIPSPETSELAPLFIKSVVYNRKKESFIQSKSSFDGAKNTFLFFLLIHLLDNKNIMGE